MACDPKTGVEVDLLLETGSMLVPIEAKLSSTPLPTMGAAIRALRKDLGGKTSPGWLVHGGDVRLPLGPSVTAIPFAEL